MITIKELRSKLLLLRLGAVRRKNALFKAVAAGLGPPPPPVPLAFAVLVVTSRCNLKCKTCLRGESSTEDLDPGLLDGLFTEMKKIGFNAVSLTGGEAILHPEFERILKIISSHGLKFGLVTNGTLYPRYLEAFKPYAKLVNFIAISLDSHLSGVNDSIRGAGTHAKALEAAAAFRKAGYFVKICHVVNKKNLAGLKDFVDFVNHRIKPGAINIMGVIRTGDNEDLVLDAEEKAAFHRQLGQLLARTRNLQVCTSAGYSRGTLFCKSFTGLSELAVNCKGDLVFCCDNTHKGAVMGNLKEKSFGEILRKYLECQLELKWEVLRDSLDSKNESTHDCNYCNKLLSGLLRK